MSLPDRIDGPLADWVMKQRWFASKARAVASVNVLERAALSVDPPLELQIVEARFQAGTHELYQLLPGEGEAGLRVLARLLGDEAQVDGVSFHGGLEPTGDVRGIGAEQSNSSIVFGEQQVLKLFRRVAPGINPELEMLRFLSARGFDAVAKLTGWYEISGEVMQATLAIMQEFVPDARDGWQVALDDPLGVLARLPELGAATGEMHSVLASDPTDTAFAPEEPSVEALSLLTATIDEQIEQVFLDLRPGTRGIEPILGRGEEVRDRLQSMSHVGVGGRLIRHHGDYHLGQTMLKQPSHGAGGGSRSGWTILDFEGEPARSLLDRRRKRSPLRDVAGMLRSFAYAASASELLRGVPAPAGWEQQAREGFLEAYLETVDQSLLPAGRPATDKLLAIFELEKAVYELSYELNNRPDWVPIPVAGIARLLQEEIPT
jgi:maltokinase